MKIRGFIPLFVLACFSGISIFFVGCGGGGSNGGGGGGGTQPPATPTGLQAMAGDTQVSLNWTASSGATSYAVKRSSAAGGPYTQIATPSATGYTDTGLTNGTTYYYVVAAVNSAGSSANSAEVSAKPVAAIPAAPTGLQAAAGNAQVSLSWTASTGATSYNVKRSTTSGSGYATISSPTATNYLDTGLNNGTTYYYVVSAVNSSGESGNSAEANAKPSTSVTPDVTITIDPANTAPISPYIYGLNFYLDNTNPPSLLTLDRAGGNRWTAYNWINNASNAGADYYYENDNYLCNGSCNAGIPAEAVRMFIAADQAAGVASLVTFQLQGYVSVDTTTIQVPRPFPNLNYFRPVVDKKSTVSGAPFTITPPAATTDNHVYMDEFAWALDQKFSGMNIFGANPAHPTFISLDNEPDLWSSTHEEIQGSTNVSSDAFISKTTTLAKALKDLKLQFPTEFSNVVLFGPVNYGFNGIYSWQGDPTLSPTPNGANWFADKYMAQIKAASAAYGEPLVDVYDFHWYSEATDGSTRVTDLNGPTLTDAQVQAIVQSPRSLWDTTYTENSWITTYVFSGPIYILSRLQAKIAAENPGMKIAITEYNNGGGQHIAGTIAQADNLGIFGAQGVFAATYWPLSSSESYPFGGFRAYRDFDGHGACFGDTTLQSTSSDVQDVTVYASLDSTTPGRVVFVAINRSKTSKITAITGQSLSGTAYFYQMTAASAQSQNIVEPVAAGQMAASGSSLTVTLPALSVTTIDVH